MLTAAADPAYREMNRVEAALSDELAGKTPGERFEQLIVWLRLLAPFSKNFEPSREIPRSVVELL